MWNSKQYRSLRKTTNNDSVEKLYTYCSECPERYGLGVLAAHLVDDTWMETLEFEASEKNKIIARRSRIEKKHQQH